MRITRKRAVLTAAGIIVLAGLVFMFLPDPRIVQTATVERGPLRVVVEEEGTVHVAQRYEITAPVSAFVRRIELDVGDPVREGQVLVRFEPPRAAILDPRGQAEADARVDAARAAVRQAEVEADRARSELRRVERLYGAEAATRQALEQATAEAARAAGALESARAELNAALAAQRSAADDPSRSVGDVVRSPANGRVLVLHRRSAGHVMAGEPLLEIGDTDALQVEAEVLSEDAVRIRPGGRVFLDQWGGNPVLEAEVVRVDPQGVTQVSALGVEEQRVRVVADIVSPSEAYAGLGPGYRVLARFVIWESDDVLQVPTAALFRRGDGWAAFTVQEGRAALRSVTVGREAGLSMQVLDGLEEGETVIVHPDNELEDGERVRPQER